ncbi:hypothetical protein N0V82_007991 [Gnomoniopsis sp. IMI 355080]|nr:hypothetical protein N0V82_007991 [Gnomoniopsis sp. IMI 355080]
MADNKGSSSNPAKGLVAHLDRNRSGQQDRLVNSSSTTPSASSFRSQAGGSSAVALDGAFNQFTNQPGGMQLGGVPMGPASSITNIHGAPAFRESANIAWADEFLQSRNQSGPVDAQLQDGSRFQYATQSNMNGSQMGVHAVTQPWSYQSDPFVTENAHMEMAARQNRAMGIAGYTPPMAQYTMYPAERTTEDVRLADSAEQAMAAAFAAYDEDFEGAMDKWMAADGAGDLENHIQNIRKMEELKIADSMVSNSGPTSSGLTTKADVPASNKFAYDKAMMKHAGDIVTTLTNNGSDEVKAKMNGSSFQGLMRAIASGKAAVVDDNFVDTSTGEVIQDLVELSGAKSAQDSDNTDSKGKGKMMNLEEQQQQQEGPA